MGYTKTTWQDRNVDTPRNFTITKSGGGAISSGDIATMTPDPGTITAVGVAPNKSRMDNMEDGIGSLYNGDALYAVTAGLTNVYTATFSPVYTALTTGLTLRVTFNIENTSASTFKLDSLTTEDLKKLNGTGKADTEAGDIVPGTYIIVYDGTDWVITNQFKVKPMNQIFTASGTFNAPFTGNYNVTVIGAGGSGGSGSASGTGGGSGGCAKEIVSLTKGDAVTVTIGAGGIGVATGNNGNGGGTSSFVTYCDATGGGGGLQNASATSTNGGIGGLGSNGDLNLAGNSAQRVLAGSGASRFTIGAGSLLGGFSATANSYGSGSDGSQGGTTGDGQDGIILVEWMEG